MPTINWKYLKCFVIQSGSFKLDGPIRPKPENQINKNLMTKYFGPYNRINRKPDDQIYPPLHYYEELLSTFCYTNIVVSRIFYHAQ